MRKALVLLVVAVLVALLGLGQLPSRVTLGVSFVDGTIPGVMHVHTNRSDGSGTPDEVAVAARRAGLAFVIFTDHGDGTRQPDAPIYRSGVLCLDAVELSTNGGHYIALDMPAAPYPLGGDPDGVVEDVRRLGGFGIVAHPTSPKIGLRWEERGAPIDGIEWLNLDTSWRVAIGQAGWGARWDLLKTLMAYPLRPAETIARLASSSALAANFLESITPERRVVMLAGADAHARLALGNSDPSDGEPSLGIPGYEPVFRAMSVRVRPEQALTGDATRDAASVIQAIRKGRTYTVVDGLAGPPAFEFTATNARGTAAYGDAIESGGPVTLHVKSNAPSSFTTTVWEGSRQLVSEQSLAIHSWQLPDVPAMYRVEVSAPSKSGLRPWIISNPIYIGLTFPGVAHAPLGPTTASQSLFDGRTTAGWRVETEGKSSGRLEVLPGSKDPELRLHYSLTAEPIDGPYVAYIARTPDLDTTADRVTFVAHANPPLRVTVKIRSRLAPGAQWAGSVYIDETMRSHTLSLDQLTHVGAAKPSAAPGRGIEDVVLQVEPTHSRPGSEGWLSIGSLSLEQSQAGGRRP